MVSETMAALFAFHLAIVIRFRRGHRERVQISQQGGALARVGQACITRAIARIGKYFGVRS
jgi:hypothetical protein